MDIYCPVCGEPWDSRELRGRKGGYAAALRRFGSDGCASFGLPHDGPFDDKATLSAIAFDLLGDDIDGIASLMEDFGL